MTPSVLPHASHAAAQLHPQSSQAHVKQAEQYETKVQTSQIPQPSHMSVQAPQ